MVLWPFAVVQTLIVWLVPLAVCSCSVFSSKQNFLIFSWLCLYSPTVLHATICIRRGFSSGSRGIVSVTIAESFFLITVFFRLSVSSVIVWGE